MIDVVAVDRAHVKETELIEQCAARDQPARVFLDRIRALGEERRQELRSFWTVWRTER